MASKTSGGQTTTYQYDELGNLLAVSLPSGKQIAYLVDVGRFSNTMVIATKQPSDLANYATNIAQLPQDSPLRQIGDLSIQTGNIRPWDGGGLVFSDNRAPVELVIDRLIIDAARHETQNR